MFDIRRLKEVRNRLGLTQRQFADQAGVSQSLIAKIESGQIDPSYSKGLKIEDAITCLTKTQEPEAKSIMTNKVIAVKINTPATEIVQLMRKHDISQLPVLEKGNVIGLVSEGSILEKPADKIKFLKAQDLMTEPPPIVSEKTKLSVITALLKQFSLVLIRKNSCFIGVITKTDLLRSIV